MIFRLSVLFCLIVTLLVSANENLLDEFLDVTDEDAEETEYSEIISRLSQHPVNLAQESDFEELFWLSKAQKIALKNLLNEDHFNYEKLLRHGFTKNEVSLLKQYTYFSKKTQYHISQRNRVYFKERDKDTHSSANLYQRLIINKNPYEICLLTQKDPSESKLFYSYYFSYQTDSTIEKIIVGRYKLSFGQGLILASKLGLSKGSAVTTLPMKTNFSLKGYSSSYEIWFLEGACAKIKLINISFIPFISFTDLPVSKEDDKITSFNETGLINSNQKYTKENIAGLHTHLNLKNLSFGSTLFYQKFDDKFADDNLNNDYYSFSTDLQFRYENLDHATEFAIADEKIAFVSLLRWGKSNFRQLLLVRHYPKYFPTWHGKPFSSQSSFDNENGIYLGWETKVKKWKIRSYFDIWNYPDTRYFEKMATVGNEEYIQAERKWKNQKVLVTINHTHHKNKDKNVSFEDIAKITSFQRTTVRFDWWQYGENVTFKNRIEYVCEHYSEYDKTEFGFLCYQMVKVTFPKWESIFQIATYHSDVLHYMYEYSLNGMMQTEILSDDGFFCYFLLNYDITSTIHFQLKISDHFNTPDSFEIGSLLEYRF